MGRHCSRQILMRLIQTMKQDYWFSHFSKQSKKFSERKHNDKLSQPSSFSPLVTPCWSAESELYVASSSFPPFLYYPALFSIILIPPQKWMPLSKKGPWCSHFHWESLCWNHKSPLQPIPLMSFVTVCLEPNLAGFVELLPVHWRIPQGTPLLISRAQVPCLSQNLCLALHASCSPLRTSLRL